MENKNREEFRTNAFLTLAMKTLFYNEGTDETKQDILEESMNIMTFLYEDIPSKDLEGLELSSIASGYLQSTIDPAVIRILQCKDAYPESKVLVDTLLGTHVSLKKMEPSQIEKIKTYQKTKK